ncbi:hypothetical protein G7K_5349-t1 [Saitoella complicata NRRL Y-17804]|uniref:Sugar phosphate transporter domain-containing protein n=1 Tax=Saitoella complicata (strain BCRC 22490 / CBS 7301 / JCM 7358 / NBRC 10748 / NRRL Y-17804) TaxID=698492 RepID=A0A0E9NNG4_SAICN|nr:hypothetical protein G7K_5349-t1 [Saitoella complicata NRRL Y-17804]
MSAPQLSIPLRSEYTPPPTPGREKHENSFSEWNNRSTGESTPERPPTLSNQYIWLTIYFFFNLALTLYNKRALISFPFPWLLTAIHALFGAVGAGALYTAGRFEPVKGLGKKEWASVIGFSGLYTVNIAISNVSLHLVTVPFHQVVRATTPLFAMIISIVCFRKSYGKQTYLSLVPVIGGVGFATAGDYSYTQFGLILTVFGAILAALKTVLTGRILTGKLKFHPLDLLLRMAPLACAQSVAYAWVTGELASLPEWWESQAAMGKQTTITWGLAINGLIAFGLNVVSFTANKKVGPVTMTVAANVKQVLTIVLAIGMFHLHISGLNAFGILLTLFGGAWYARVEMQNKARSNARVPQPVLPLTSVDEKTKTIG